TSTLSEGFVAMDAKSFARDRIKTQRLLKFTRPIVKDHSEKIRFHSSDSIYIGSLEHKNKAYLKSDRRPDFFEIIWIKDEQPKVVDENAYSNQSDWMYLMPPGRHQQLTKIGKKGLLIGFDKSVLDYEVSEFTLDVLKLFTKQGDFSTL